MLQKEYTIKQKKKKEKEKEEKKRKVLIWHKNRTSFIILIYDIETCHWTSGRIIVGERFHCSSFPLLLLAY